MIVASPKSVTELKQLIDRHQKVLFVGCGTCVTVCLAGGEREVGIAGYGVRMARKLAKQPVEIEQVTIERQCDNEFIKDLAPAVERSQAVVSFGCAAGVQAIAERFPGKPVYPGLNTQFLGILEEQATWTEKCIGCGECMLAEFGGVCPVTRCAKHMLNGPCGGSTSERCEVSADKPCAWQLIFKRLQSIGQLDRLEKIHPPKDWSKAWHGGARKIVRPEHRISDPALGNSIQPRQEPETAAQADQACSTDGRADAPREGPGRSKEPYGLSVLTVRFRMLSARCRASVRRPSGMRPLVTAQPMTRSMRPGSNLPLLMLIRSANSTPSITSRSSIVLPKYSCAAARMPTTVVHPKGINSSHAASTVSCPAVRISQRARKASYSFRLMLRNRERPCGRAMSCLASCIGIVVAPPRRRFRTSTLTTETQSIPECLR